MPWILSNKIIKILNVFSKSTKKVAKKVSKSYTNNNTNDNWLNE